MDFFTCSSFFGVAGVAGADLRESDFFLVSVGAIEVVGFSPLSLSLAADFDSVDFLSPAAFLAAKTSSLFHGNIDGVEFDLRMILPLD